MIMKMKKTFLTLLAIVACGFVWLCGVSMTAPHRVSTDVRGDVTGDGVVDIDDLNAVINVMVHKNADAGIEARSDIDGNGVVDIDDLNVVVNVMLGKEPGGDTPVTQTFTVNGVSFKMIAVEGGTFTMGGSDDDPKAKDNEKPAHQVTLSSFAIGETEVTQELWLAVMGSNPSYFNGHGNPDFGSYQENVDYGTNLQRPVEYVKRDDCEAFAAKLSELTGQHFRLPTEAEWEYAARGGNKSKGYIYAGSDYIREVAWYYGTTSYIPTTPDYGTHTVATKLPNELGLYDMSGNVWEWCSGWYHAYTTDPQTNPDGNPWGWGTYYVRRGGAWNYDDKYCRVSAREHITTYAHSQDVGMRLVLGGAY